MVLYLRSIHKVLILGIYANYCAMKETYLYYFILLMGFTFFLAACDQQKKFQQAKVKKYESKIEINLPIGHAYTKLPANISIPIAQQRRLFVDMLKGYEDTCLSLIHLYHPTNIHMESIALCVKVETKDVGIYQAQACVIALIDHLYQKPMPYYSEKKLHWGIDKACTEDALKNKLNKADTLSTVNPITYAKMKLKEDGFNMQVVQDRLNIASTLKHLIQ